MCSLSYYFQKQVFSNASLNPQGNQGQAGARILPVLSDMDQAMGGVPLPLQQIMSQGLLQA